MARTITMAPHAPRPSVAKPAQAKRQDDAAKPAQAKRPAGKPAVPPPAHTSNRHPAHRGGMGGWATLAVVALAAAGAGLWFALGGPPPMDTSAQLLAQMEAAAQGAPVPTHVFGGALTVSAANGRTNVVAEAVPSRACVQVGWRLAREGTIIVNGTLPQRLSAAKLSELCSGEGATLLWVPDE